MFGFLKRKKKEVINNELYLLIENKISRDLNYFFDYYFKSKKLNKATLSIAPFVQVIIEDNEIAFHDIFLRGTRSINVDFVLMKDESHQATMLLIRNVIMQRITSEEYLLNYTIDDIMKHFAKIYNSH